jgi:hypothetical protein
MNKLDFLLITKFNEVDQRLAEIDDNNATRQKQSKWSESKTRIITMVLLIYLVSLIIFRFMGVESPFLIAGILTFGYYFSTLLLEVIKKRFMEKL